LLALALLLLAYWLLDPAPPKQVTLATGQERSDYAEFGARYAKALARDGIRVVQRGTHGAAENLALLRDPGSGVDIAFVQGGGEESGNADARDEDLVSLGSLFYEPVWLFYREDAAQRLLKTPTLSSLAQLPGWRVSVGTPGSGVPQLMQRLFEANALDPKTLTLLPREQTPAVVELLDGSLDALVFASAPESLMVQMLLRTPGVKLFDFAQSEAYARRFAFLSPVVLPRGIVDLAADRPGADVHLVAPTAMLVARKDTHPALVQLFVQAAHQVHGGAGWFQRKGDFPNTRNTELPLADEAERFFKDGPPLLQRYLPFWLANLVDRMWVVLISIVAVLIPLSRVVPPLYEFRIRSRIFRWYGQLRTVEGAIGERPLADLLGELDGIEQRVGQISVPLSYADELYALRSHIGLVRQRLLSQPGAVSG
ncbi:MAG: C4-dicarboxylate ABC transporter substrate-binding protein, partial [Burkholderiaceae bacterium]|nr:C4-dicarboxylate ABC transporter substrate-binding protein [Burkholderiaceae bacterium]